MSAFTEQLEKQPTGQRGPRCPVEIVLGKLDTDSSADVVAALADTAQQGAKIARALTRMGHPISVEKVQRHRRGDCRCA